MSVNISVSNTKQVNCNNIIEKMILNKTFAQNEQISIILLTLATLYVLIKN